MPIHDDDEDAPYKFHRPGDDEDDVGYEASDEPSSIDFVRCPHCKKFCHEQSVQCPRCKHYIVEEPWLSKPRWYVLTVVLVLLLVTLFWVFRGNLASWL